MISLQECPARLTTTNCLPPGCAQETALYSCLNCTPEFWVSIAARFELSCFTGPTASIVLRDVKFLGLRWELMMMARTIIVCCHPVVGMTKIDGGKSVD